MANIHITHPYRHKHRMRIRARRSAEERGSWCGVCVLIECAALFLGRALFEFVILLWPFFIPYTHTSHTLARYEIYAQSFCRVAWIITTHTHTQRICIEWIFDKFKMVFVCNTLSVGTAPSGVLKEATLRFYCSVAIDISSATVYTCTTCATQSGKCFSCVWKSFRGAINFWNILIFVMSGDWWSSLAITLQTI